MTIDEEKENDLEYQKNMKKKYRNLFLAYKELEAHQRELAERYKNLYHLTQEYKYNLIYKPES